ncbi:hypothetical protein, partial [Streptomyces sparsus]
MTVPTPPPPHNGSSQPPQYDPWVKPPQAADAEWQTGDAEPRAISGREEVRDLLLVAVVLTVAGGLLGLLWWWLASPVRYVSDGQNALLGNTEAEDTFAVDGTFALLAMGLGVVSGLLLFLVRRGGGVGAVLGLALGSVLASVVGWRLGVLLGPGQDLTARAAEAGRGSTLEAPLQLGATAVLLAWPLAAVATHLVAVAF